MKNIFTVIITVILVSLFQWFLPWYSLAIPTFVIGFLMHRKKAFPVFCIGFLVVFILWFSVISYLNVNNHSILANRLSLLFFKHQFVLILITINSLIGGLVAGISMMSGHYLRDAL